MPEKLQTILFLVRHGQTDQLYSQDKVVDDQRQLTQFGQQQSQLVGRFLDQFTPVVVYTSPLDRCRKTAEIIVSKITPKPPIILAKTLVEVYSTAPEVRQEVGERGESIFSTVLREHRGEQVIAVTHQYIIGYIVADFLAIEYQEVRCDFADIYRLVFAAETLVEATRLQPAKVLSGLN